MRCVGRIKSVAASLLLVAACSDGDTANRGQGNRGTPQAPNVPNAPAGGAPGFGNATMQPMTAPPPAATGSAKRACKVITDADPFELPVCKLSAPANSFDPKLQWSVELGNGYGPPLVANLTDDNADGAIDLCDTPDVIVVAGFQPPDLFAGRFFPEGAHIYALDGATGTQHFESQTTVTAQITPAVGDIDGDGLPEIVALGFLLDQFLNGEPLSGLVAFDHLGKVQWQVPLDFTNYQDQRATLGISIHDLEGDGQAEVVVATSVFDGKTGELKWDAPDSTFALSSLVVDLDNDGKLEVVTGLAAFDSEGTQLWDRTDLTQGNGFLADIINLVGVYPIIVNFDDDAFPEIVLAAGPGVYVLEHDGQTKMDASGSAPLMFKSGEQGLDLGDFKPPTAHDFDGDGSVDLALGTLTGFTVLNRQLQPIYRYTEIDQGLTATTAFDFLGDGKAEAIYADKDELLFFDVANQKVVMTWPHSGQLDYPIVVDVDNDDSAEVVVVSGGTIDTSAILPFFVEKTAPTVQVLTDAQNRWIPTRRVWNMANYHVTHVREDATIPTRETPHYVSPNTFRTNVQYEAGGICKPPGPD